MPSLRSVEVRWFGMRRTPIELEEWFGSSGGRPAETSCRTDRYLWLCDTDALGIKLREGRLEIKQRTIDSGVLAFPGGARGRVEAWRKWCCSAAGESDVAWPGDDESGWIDVVKERRLRSFKQLSDGSLAGCRADEYPPAGGHLELTRLDVAEARPRHWWTLGAEAFGSSDDLFALLRRLIGHDAPRTLPAALAGTVSCGYPAWLRQACG